MTALASFSGRVQGRPHVRGGVAGPDGRSVPVLCLDIVPEGGASTAPVHVRQPFPHSDWRGCEAAARRIQPGQHITVQAPIDALRLTITAAAHIITTHPEQ